jgi:hypothetical protein
MGRSSLRHSREQRVKDSADQINLPGTGGGYGGGAVGSLPRGQLGGDSAWPAPGNLLVTSAGADSASVSWDVPTPDPSDGTSIFGYNLYRDGVLLWTANLTSPQVDDGPLVVGQKYNYLMAGFDSTGQRTDFTAYQYTHA